MTIKARYFTVCPRCATEQPVSDYSRPYEHESAGRFLLIHAPFNLRCEGSGVRVAVFWRDGEMFRASDYDAGVM